jgi:hypothetical protein
MKSVNIIVIALLLVGITTKAQKNFYEPLNIDTVSWSYEDLGKMWTFDSVPIEMFENKYGFKPTSEWLDDVKKSALQFGNGCSAAFVSGDGLIMTNHHCGRNRLSSVQKDGEEILKNGFYAHNLEDERRIKNLYVDQLITIEDVTERIKNFISTGKSDEQKVKLRDEIKKTIVEQYEEETGLNCKIVSLYHGGKYSLYGYKRYDDIRLVMAPDFQIAATGWDWDNFTYPRYELDFMFYRAYDEEGNPVKPDNYFKWSQSGAEEGEPIFVVGRPGRTDRLYSYAQLEYLRDYSYRTALIGYNAIYYAYYDYYMKYPENEELLNSVMRWGNSRKSYAGRLAGLNDDYIMKKKRDFQNDLIRKVNSDKDLKAKYSHVWEAIEAVIKELRQYSTENTIVRFNRFLKPVYYDIAKDLLKLARQKELSDDDRDKDYKDANLEETVMNLFPEDINSELEDKKFLASIEFLSAVLNESDTLLESLFENRKGEEVAAYFKENSKIITKEGFKEIASMNSEDILNSEDPFINLVTEFEELSNRITPKVQELNNTLSVLNELLGEAVYYVYGDNIPPDATSTLRISDGTIKGYEYNGTIAPGKTTYYGLWDRYESFNKKTYPWGLHKRWKVPPKELDLSTSVGFASTNDIVGGNSGSSVINKNKEVVGLVHDGNVESLAGHTIFLEENNRTVATDSDGLIEALKYIYKSERLVKELLNGKL